MKAIVTAVIAAIEGAAAALIGWLVVAVPAVLLWAVTFGLAAEPGAVLSAIAGIWLLGHRVPLTFEFSAEAAAGLGLEAEGFGFVVSLAPLGIALVTVLIALRAGWRAGERGGAGAAAVLGGAIGVGAMAAGAASLGGGMLAVPYGVAMALPAAFWALPSAIGFLIQASRLEHPWWRTSVRRLLRLLQRGGLQAAALPKWAGRTMRLAGATSAAAIGIAALALAIALVMGYASVTALTQGLQPDLLGSILLFLAQLAFLPVWILWALSWMTGAGFSIGEGTSVTPFETLLGPLPSVPVFGAIPGSWGDYGGFAPAILVLGGVVVGLLFARGAEQRRASWAVGLAIPAIAGALVGLAVAGCMLLADGALGPDRLALTGPAPWTVGGLAAAELGAGLLLGTAAARLDLARLRSRVSDMAPVQEGLRRLRRDEEEEPFGTGPADADPGAVDGGAVGEATTVDLGEFRVARAAEREAQGVPSLSDADPWGELGRPAGSVVDDDFETAEISVEGESLLDVRAAEDGLVDGGDPHAEDTPHEFREPELFDQEQTGSIDPSTAEASDAAGGSGEALGAEAETEELLRAYSWDGSGDPLEPAAEPDRRPRWRWPRGKR